MRYTFVFVALSLLLTACSRRDAKLAKQISGSWDSGADDAMAMSSDGSFSETFFHGGRTNFFAGTWQVKDGFLVFTITNVSATEPHAPVGSVRRFKIDHVDDHELVYGEVGHTTTLKR
jgi:hypothetical protein